MHKVTPANTAGVTLGSVKLAKKNQNNICACLSFRKIRLYFLIKENINDNFFMDQLHSLKLFSNWKSSKLYHLCFKLFQVSLILIAKIKDSYIINSLRHCQV